MSSVAESSNSLDNSLQIQVVVWLAILIVLSFAILDRLKKTGARLSLVVARCFRTAMTSDGDGRRLLL